MLCINVLGSFLSVDGASKTDLILIISHKDTGGGSLPLISAAAGPPRLLLLVGASTTAIAALTLVRPVVAP